ncbi:cytochrome c3 family protein [Ferrimonas senticii]|uniref:cytochrome c3 family protein n=1 Tax=Ferrimonas senticii TaxID=394566 RepID=UPI0003F9BB0B|nr:cytochrome c3 family protein [Ferrimonas senticii]
MKVIILLPALLLSASLQVSANDIQMSDKHAMLECDSCHNSELAHVVAPSDQSCLECHGPMADLVAATHTERQPHDTKVAPNPHDSAHYGTTMSCFACHAEHKPAKVFCDTCHAFDYQNFK